MYKSKKKFINAVVEFSIGRLLSEAKKNSKKHPERSKRYLYLVRKFIQRYKFKITGEQKLMFCKKCLVWWANKKTLAIKDDKKRKIIEYKCLNCGYIKRIPYYPKK
ncbi:MAG: hypothetical protein WC501_03690 [Candidatus Micrarchaeia archaeon]